MFHDSNGNLSSKRIVGTMLILYAAFMVLSYSMKDVDIPDNMKDVLISFVYGGFAAIGVGTFEKKSQ